MKSQKRGCRTHEYKLAYLRTHRKKTTYYICQRRSRQLPHHPSHPLPRSLPTQRAPRLPIHRPSHSHPPVHPKLARRLQPPHSIHRQPDHRKQVQHGEELVEECPRSRRERRSRSSRERRSPRRPHPFRSSTAHASQHLSKHIATLSSSRSAHPTKHGAHPAEPHRFKLRLLGLGGRGRASRSGGSVEREVDFVRVVVERA